MLRNTYDVYLGLSCEEHLEFHFLEILFAVHKQYNLSPISLTVYTEKSLALLGTHFPQASPSQMLKVIMSVL